MLHICTPLRRDHHRSTGQTQVFLKLDCYQPSGSFKIRGIGHLCQYKASKGAPSFVCSSGGNAGLAVAYCGQTLNLPVHIVVPQTTSQAIQNMLKACGAKVTVHGSVWDDADVYARQLAHDIQAAYIHPFDDPLIWTGHASIIDELQNHGTKPDLIVCSVGGGGLLCGIMEGLYRNNWHDVEILAVETVGAASLQASVQAGQRVSIPAITSIAKTLGAKMVAQKAFEWTRIHPIHCAQVSDNEAINACIHIADEWKMLVEPACGAAYAAVSQPHPAIMKATHIVVIICGGSGVDTDMLLDWKQEYRS
ncbi:MAG: pyridoxal-phosphate dependent enzyme [Myxococcota bacterium]